MSSRVFSMLHTNRPKELSYAAWHLLHLMEERYSYEKHCAFFKLSYAATRLSASRRYVQLLINELEGLGLVRVYERPHRPNRYVVPLLPGEILPADIVIPDGPVLIDPETQQEWTLRDPHQCDSDDEREMKKRQRDAEIFNAALAKKKKKAR